MRRPLRQTLTGVGEDRVCRSDAGGDAQRLEERDGGDKEVDESRADKPRAKHDWEQEDEEGESFALEVGCLAGGSTRAAWRDPWTKSAPAGRLIPANMTSVENTEQ